MADRSRDPRIEAHIESISTRAETDIARLLEGMLGRCWPGGASDRTAPAAREWVRRWGPRRVGVLPPACSCRAGGCGVCN